MHRHRHHSLLTRAALLGSALTLALVVIHSLGYAGDTVRTVAAAAPPDYPDPAGDVAEPRGDIVNVYFSGIGATIFEVTFAQSDPITSTNWASSETMLELWLDTSGDHRPEYRMAFEGNGSFARPTFSTVDGGSCQVDYREHLDQRKLGMVVHPQCAGYAHQIWWCATFSYKNQETGITTIDSVPQSGWIGPIEGPGGPPTPDTVTLPPPSRPMTQPRECGDHSEPSPTGVIDGPASVTFTATRGDQIQL